MCGPQTRPQSRLWPFAKTVGRPWLRLNSPTSVSQADSINAAILIPGGVEWHDEYQKQLGTLRHLVHSQRSRVTYTSVTLDRVTSQHGALSQLKWRNVHRESDGLSSYVTTHRMHWSWMKYLRRRRNGCGTFSVTVSKYARRIWEKDMKQIKERLASP
jgi:hypothetical protein